MGAHIDRSKKMQYRTTYSRGPSCNTMAARFSLVLRSPSILWYNEPKTIYPYRRFWMPVARLLSWCFCLVLTGAATAGPVEILLTGTWHGDEVQAEPGPDWWGIFPEGDGFTLQLAPVTMTLEEDGIVDDPGEMTGKKVSVPQEASPVLLVRGLKEPVQGTIAVPESQPAGTLLYPGQSLYLSLPQAQSEPSLRLVALGVARERTDFPDIGIYDYELRLYQNSSQGTITQSLRSFPNLDSDAQPRLLWAGDLDRDGRMDLLFDLTDHYNVSRLTLFLSSAAKEGELVGKVAEWITTGC